MHFAIVKKLADTLRVAAISGERKYIETWKSDTRFVVFYRNFVLKKIIFSSARGHTIFFGFSFWRVHE